MIFGRSERGSPRRARHPQNPGGRRLRRGQDDPGRRGQRDQTAAHGGAAHRGGPSRRRRRGGRGQEHHHRGHGLRPHHPARGPGPLPVRDARAGPLLVPLGRAGPGRPRRGGPRRHPEAGGLLRGGRLLRAPRHPVHGRRQLLRRAPSSSPPRRSGRHSTSTPRCRCCSATRATGRPSGMCSWRSWSTPWCGPTGSGNPPGPDGRPTARDAARTPADRGTDRGRARARWPRDRPRAWRASPGRPPRASRSSAPPPCASCRTHGHGPTPPWRASTRRPRCQCDFSSSRSFHTPVASPAAYAAPRQVVSETFGRITGTPRTSAWCCISRLFAVIPPSTFRVVMLHPGVLVHGVDDLPRLPTRRLQHRARQVPLGDVPRETGDHTACVGAPVGREQTGERGHDVRAAVVVDARRERLDLVGGPG